MEIKEHMEVLKNKMWLEKDDLKDTGLILDYATAAKECGDTEAAAWFHKRAKQRWAQYEEDDAAVDRAIEKMRGMGNDAPDSIQATMLAMLMEEQDERAMHLRKKIETFAV